MKIISKYKDYYDYYTGVWGEDPLKVLDRRKYVSWSKEYQIPNFLLLYFSGLFCGNYYVRINKSVLERYKQEPWASSGYVIYVPQYGGCTILEEIEGEDVNWYKIQPKDEMIVAEPMIPYFLYQYEPDVFPILSDLGFQAVLSPREAFLSVEEFISNKDIEVPSDPTDMNRYAGKGFDIKTSFRNIKK